jgi:hypothetical protein
VKIEFVLPVAALALVAGGLAGAAVEHNLDDQRAASDLYRNQVLTTLTQFMNAEGQVIAQPAAKRDFTALDNLAEVITADPGVNGGGTLTVTQGSGAARNESAIWTVTLDSAHGGTAFAVWYLTPGGPSTISEGACVLSSTLLGPGEGLATSDLNLGGGSYVTACPAQYWTMSSDPDQPDFAAAGIRQQNLP